MSIFDDIVEKCTPKVNKDVMHGLVTKFMTPESVIARMETIIHSASSSFPPGLTYSHCEIATTQQEYEWTTKERDEKRKTMEISASDIFLVLFYFKYNGAPLQPAYIYLPFCREGGVAYFSGTQYRYMPVMASKVITPGSSSVFVRLQLRDRLKFMSVHHSYVMDSVVHNGSVVWSAICRKPKEQIKLKDTTKAMTCCAHYLLAVYGFSGAMGRYFGMTKGVDFDYGYSDKIDYKDYPPQEWSMFTSIKVAPKTYVGKYYTPSKTVFLIKKEKVSKELESFMASVFYIIDHFPESINPTTLESTSQYVVLLGHIVRTGLYSTDKLITFISNHLSEVDDYLDKMTQQKLKEIGIDVGNFYDFLFYLSMNYYRLTTTTKDEVLSMFNKHLELLYYVLYPLSSHLLTTIYGLTNNKKSHMEISEKLLNEQFIRPICRREVFKLTSGDCPAIEVFSYPGDHLYPKITSKINHQEIVPSKRSGGKSRSSAGPDKYFHVSMFEAGCVLVLPKRDPMPWRHLNPYTCIEMNTGTIIPNPINEEILAKTKPLMAVIDGYVSQEDENADHEQPDIERFDSED
jgi:hypothetical protein